MRLNFFRVFIYIQSVINLSADFINSSKFTRQRLKRIVKLQMTDRTERLFQEWCLLYCATLPDSSLDAPEVDRTRLRRRARSKTLRRELYQMFKYEELGLLNSSVYLLHMASLTYLVIKHALYTAFPKSQMGFSSEVRTFLRFILIYDTFEGYSSSYQYNAIQFLMLVSPLIQRIWMLRLKLQIYGANRRHYKKVNVVSLNMAYLDQFKLTPIEWCQLLIGTVTHKCDNHRCLSSPEGEKLRLAHRWTKMLNPIDKTYFINPIDFNKCYKVNFWPERNKQTGLDYVVRRRRSNENLGKKSRLSRLLKTFEARHWFLPQQGHRLDLSYVLIFLVVAGSTALLFCTMNFIVFWARVYHPIMLTHSSHDKSFSVYSIYRVFTNVDWTLELIFLILDTLMIEGLISFGACDYLMLFVSTNIHISRAIKVVKMLNYEVKMVRVNQDLTTLTAHLQDKDQAWKPRCNGPKLKIQDQNVESFSSNSSTYSVAISSERIVYFSNASKPSMCKLISNCSKDLQLDYRGRFNKNLEYLLDLCMISMRELKDLKEWYTFYLNLSIIVSTFNSAYSIILLRSIKSTSEVVIVAQIIVMCLLPLVAALILGAWLESTSRKIYWAVNRAMSLDSRLVGLKLKKRMLKFLIFLSRDESRGFLLLGNVPLTTATIIPVLTSVCTSYLLLSRTM